VDLTRPKHGAVRTKQQQFRNERALHQHSHSASFCIRAAGVLFSIPMTASFRAVIQIEAANSMTKMSLKTAAGVTNL